MKSTKPVTKERSNNNKILLKGKLRPVEVIGVTVGEECGDGFGYFLVGEDVPEAVGCHHQNIIGPVFTLRQVVHLNLHAHRTLSDGKTLIN